MGPILGRDEEQAGKRVGAGTGLAAELIPVVVDGDGGELGFRGG